MKDTVTSMVPIKLDKPRHLFYSMKGFLYLAERYGDAGSAFAKIPSGKDSRMGVDELNALVDLIFAGLMHEDDSLSRDDVARIIDIRRLGFIAEAISKAMATSLPESEGDEGDPR